MDDLPTPARDPRPAPSGQGNPIATLAFVFLLGAGITAAGLALSNRIRPAPIEILPPPPAPTAAPTATPAPVRVYVNGQVIAPAVYQLPGGSIVQQAIEAAGGLTAAADVTAVNLAQPLFDGAQVYIPSVSEPVATPGSTVVMPGAPADGDPTTPDGLVNINTATQAALEALPGIGPTLAQRIILYRESHGPFAETEHIMQVEGIGQGRFDLIAELITTGANRGSLP